MLIFFAFFLDLTWTDGSLVFAEDLGRRDLELPEDLIFLDGRESIEQYSNIVGKHELIKTKINLYHLSPRNENSCVWKVLQLLTF